MKKNLIKLSSLLLVSLFTLTSCEEDRIVYGGGDFVTFDAVNTTTISHSEADGVLEIPVNITMPQANDVVVNFTVTSDNSVAGTDYNLITPGSVTIPAGQTTANIQIGAIDNDIFNESSILNVTLTSVSVPGIAVGITDEGSYYKKVVITNDDCPTQFMNWFGSLSLYDVGYDTYAGTGSANETGDCDVLVVTGDVAGGGIATGSFDFFFVPDSEGATSGTINVPSQLYCTACSGGLDVNYVATGTYDETTNTILVNYTLVRSNGTTVYTGQLEVTPN
jgi:hypothetical protein